MEIIDLELRIKDGDTFLTSMTGGVAWFSPLPPDKFFSDDAETTVLRITTYNSSNEVIKVENLNQKLGKP